MSFKSWALANPTKTWGYLKLQKEARSTRGWLVKEKQQLKDLDNGIPPEWFNSNNDEGGTFLVTPKMFGIKNFRVAMTEQLYRDIGCSPQEAKEKALNNSKEADLKRWESEAVEAKERENRRLELAIKMEKELVTNSLNSSQENLKKIEREISEYKVEPEIFFYEHLDNWEHIEQCIEHRLKVLIPDVALEIESIGDFSTMIEDIVEELDLTVDFRRSFKRDYWWARISDGEISFTRTHYSGDMTAAIVNAFAIALLRYLDHKWDSLVQEHAY